MKYTAIEWLVEQLEGDDAIIARVIGLKKYNEIYKKAKEMEEQQMLEFWNGGIDCTEEGGKSFEEYYNEQFKNKQQ